MPSGGAMCDLAGAKALQMGVPDPGRLPPPALQRRFDALLLILCAQDVQKRVEALTGVPTVYSEFMQAAARAPQG
eukprot:6200839-Pleurochrysis_carterae.AAC.2